MHVAFNPIVKKGLLAEMVLIDGAFYQRSARNAEKKDLLIENRFISCVTKVTV